MSLWDAIGRRTRKKLAAIQMLQPPDGSRSECHSFYIRVLKDQVEVLRTGTLLPALIPLKDMIEDVSANSIPKLTVITSPTQEVEALYITDGNDKRSFTVPKHLWEQVCTELGLDTTSCKEC